MKPADQPKRPAKCISRTAVEENNEGVDARGSGVDASNPTAEDTSYGFEGLDDDAEGQGCSLEVQRSDLEIRDRSDLRIGLSVLQCVGTRPEDLYSVRLR